MYFGKFIDKYYNFLLAIIINCMILSFEKHISEGEKMAFLVKSKKYLI